MLYKNLKASANANLHTLVLKLIFSTRIDFECNENSPTGKFAFIRKLGRYLDMYGTKLVLRTFFLPFITFANKTIGR